MARKNQMRNDWGTIAHVRKGVWRIRYWAETDTGYRRCSETIRGTRREAGDRLAELRVLHGHDAPCPTVGNCWEHWYLPDRVRMVSQGDLAPQSLEQYQSTWRCHVKPRWAHMAVDRVRALDVQQWLLGLKRAAAESSMHLLRQILDYPLRYGLIANNPMTVRYLLPSASTSRARENGSWSPDELGEVWHASLGTWFEPAVLLCGFGGCRVGESLAVRGADVRLEWMDVFPTGTSFVADGSSSLNELAARESTQLPTNSVTEQGFYAVRVPVAFVTIERQIDAHAREASRTKNRWSARTALLAGRPAERLAVLAHKYSAEEYLTHPDGLRYATQKMLRETFFACLEEHGVPVHLFKNLRKTWQTNSRWVLGLPPWVVEPMMGHAGSGVTGKFYDKPSEEQMARVLASAWAAQPFADHYPWLNEVH